MYPTILKPPALRADVERGIIAALAGTVAQRWLAHELGVTRSTINANAAGTVGGGLACGDGSNLP